MSKAEELRKIANQWNQDGFANLPTVVHALAELQDQVDQHFQDHDEDASWVAAAQEEESADAPDRWSRLQADRDRHIEKEIAWMKRAEQAEALVLENHSAAMEYAEERDAAQARVAELEAEQVALTFTTNESIGKYGNERTLRVRDQARLREAERMAKGLTEWIDMLHDATQTALQPPGKSDKWFADRLHYLLDGPEQRAAEKPLRTFLASSGAAKEEGGTLEVEYDHPVAFSGSDEEDRNTEDWAFLLRKAADLLIGHGCFASGADVAMAAERFLQGTIYTEPHLRRVREAWAADKNECPIPPTSPCLHPTIVYASKRLSKSYCFDCKEEFEPGHPALERDPM